MAIQPLDLETPERGMRLHNRKVQAPARPAADDLAGELERQKERIRKARSMVPPPDQLHCRDCWIKGRDAALRVIEGG